MVGSSKILTVKYGTFSCTAEGFEDPLGAVKDTTHFFRHVVQDDRFFGAEPPRFDAALAEELLRDQLAGSLRDGHLTVRPDGERQALAGEATREADPATTESARATERPEAAEAGTDAAASGNSDTPASEPPAAPWVDATERAAPAAPQLNDSLAEKLARIRAVVGATASGSELDGAQASSSHGDDETGDTPRAEEAPKIADDFAYEDGAVPAVARARDRGFAATPDAYDAGRILSDSDDPEPHETPAPDDWPGVRRLEAPTNAGLSLPEPDDLDHTDPSGADLANDDMQAPEGFLETDNQEADAAEAPGAWPAEQVTSDSAGDADTCEEGAADAAEEVSAGPLEGDYDYSAWLNTDDAPNQAWDTGAKPGIEHASDAWEDETRDPRVEDASAPEENEHAISDATILGERSDRLAEESSLSAEDEDELFRELAAVRAELQAAPATTSAKTPFRLDNPILSDDEDTAEDERAESAADDATAPVSDAVHTNDLDGIAAKAEPDQPEDSFLARASAGARKAVRLASPARAMLTQNSVGDTDASRLLDQTDSQLDEPEGSRRRSAIAHLRAAVAATRADRALQPEKTDAETERYREDLAKVVRPRRPKVLRSIRTERPAAEAPAAPLQLVSEQRVAEAPAGPVRPRRVSIAEDIGPAPEADQDGDAGGGFADYAASVGATRLPDLLEAAAAYMAFVEGRDQFSRPQLMTVLNRVEGGIATREERLRSFGRLLRDGKIEKARGGRFTASDSIGFRPDARQAG